MSIVRINEFRATLGEASALRSFLQSVIDIIRTAPGCQSCELLVRHEDDTNMVIVERWDSIAAHQAAASMIPSEKLAEVRPLLAEPPAGHYFDTSR